MEKEFKVEIPVCEIITKYVKAETEEQALEIAIKKAIDEDPKVYWVVDENDEITVTEELK